MWEVTIIIFMVFAIFQTVYTLVPLFVNKKKGFDKEIDEKGMSILIPAYNESVVIENCINASLEVEYENKEIIIINDGSKDDTMDVLKELLNLEEITRKKSNVLKHNAVKAIYISRKHEQIIVIDKMNGGKADALNAGIEYASKELVITLDADSMLQSDSLQYLNHYFEDEEILAAGGTVHVVQGFERNNGEIKCKFKGNGVIKHQILHYIHGFYVKKLTQSVFDSIVVIAGAFGTFRRDVLLNIDGFRQTVGEDMDITMKIHKYIHENNINGRLEYAPEAVCYTECPEDLNNFYSQRIRWQKAFIDCIVEYWPKFFSGLGFNLSFFAVVDGFLLGTIAAFTTIAGPLITGFGLKAMIAMLVFLLYSTIFDFLQNVVALIVATRYGIKYKKREYLKMCIFMLWDRFTYKLFPIYLNTVGTVKYFVEEDKWNTVQRKGEVSIV